LCFIGLQLYACDAQRKPVKSDREMKQLKEPLVNVNKYLVEQDHQRIAKFVERRGWEFNNTETGLWYQVYEKGSEYRVMEGDQVEFQYTTTLLDGTICYSSDSLGTRSLIVGRGHDETGLEEAFALLHYGDKARIILPPHLAFGLIGDENKIPPRSIVMFEVEIIFNPDYLH